MPPGLQTSISWAAGRYVRVCWQRTRTLRDIGAHESTITMIFIYRLMRKGVESGELEFTRILKDRTSDEERTTIYQAWMSACQRACAKAQESSNLEREREYADALKRVQKQAEADLGHSADSCDPTEPIRNTRQ